MYIEFVIADNFLLTYLAGAVGSRSCHNKPNVWRLLCASVVGTTVAVFYPFMRLNRASTIAVKLSLWIVLSVIMYIRTPRAAASSIMFLGATFAFGGASYALGLILYGNGTAATEFTLRCPLFLTLGCGVAAYACIRYCIKRMRLPRAREPYEYGTQIDMYGVHMKFSAFLDTGNCVFDGITGLPVIITDLQKFADKLNGDAAVKFVKNLPKLRTITVKTPAGETCIYVLQPNAITVYSDRHEHKIDAMVGLVKNGGSKFTSEHELLLNPAALSEGV